MKGCVHVYTGNGKGKTTCAVGLLVRALGAGLRCLLVQFVKNAPTGELVSLERLGCPVLRMEGGNCKFTWDMSPQELADDGRCQQRLLERAEAALGAQRELPLYRHDAAYAREQGDLDLYRASRRANIACKEAIETAIADNYRDNRLDRDAVPQVIEQFGYTCTLYVLANTVQQKEWDGRFSPANKAWAKTVDIPPNPDGFGGERNLDFVVDSDIGLVDLFLSQARQDYLRLQPLTPEEIHAEAARLLQELRAPDTPNSPHGTHYMARVSPDFLARAGTQAHDQLMALLPFRSLAITGMKDLPGTYVTILASEDRSKELRQRRPSVRRQLKQEPRSAEKKAPVRKKKEPER